MLIAALHLFFYIYFSPRLRYTETIDVNIPHLSTLSILCWSDCWSWMDKRRNMMKLGKEGNLGLLS